MTSKFNKTAPIVSGKRVRKAVDRDSLDDIVYVGKKKRGAVNTNGNYGLRPGYKDNSIPIQSSSTITLSRLDKAPQLELVDNDLECVGCLGGYRMVRATNAVVSGVYYYEVEILDAYSDNAHVRLGWSSRQGELQAPVGFDKYSFGYRDTNGAKVHDSLRIDDYGEAFGEGDIIGCSIRLDDTDSKNNEIRFFMNGKDQGIAYSGAEVPHAMYFPAISLYMKAHIRVNFGPSFIIKPEVTGYLPVSEMQPMSLEDRKIHEHRIANIRAERVSNASQRSIEDESMSMITSTIGDMQ